MSISDQRPSMYTNPSSRLIVERYQLTDLAERAVFLRHAASTFPGSTSDKMRHEAALARSISNRRGSGVVRSMGVLMLESTAGSPNKYVGYGHATTRNLRLSKSAYAQALVVPEQPEGEEDEDTRPPRKVPRKREHLSLEGLYVSPDRRGHGVGAVILELLPGIAYDDSPVLDPHDLTIRLSEGTVEEQPAPADMIAPDPEAEHDALRVSELRRRVREAYPSVYALNLQYAWSSPY